MSAPMIPLRPPPGQMAAWQNPSHHAASRRVTVPAAGAGSFARALLDTRAVTGHGLLRGLALQRQHGGSLVDILLAQGLGDEGALYSVMARHWRVPLVNPAGLPPEPGLIDRFGAERALRHHLLPWRNAGRTVVVLAAHPEDFTTHRAELEASLGPVTLALAPAHQIERAILASHGPSLARAAELSVPARDSSRTWTAESARRWLGLVGVAAAALLWVAPQVPLILLVAWVLVTLMLTVGLKAAAALASLRAPTPAGTPPVIARLPVVSVMVALYREAGIAPRLIRRLEALDYPRDLLDVVLVVEAEDSLTRDALARAGLPPWMRVVAVPPGRVKTKPRALNYAMGLCRGSIIGVYDAEDAPAPDQIMRVVQRFHESPPKVACLQGVLDFYNPRANWMARCFAMEYAAWFRVILPGLARLGMPVPLGGTTLFFRRRALEELGAWDAWNVTEDADLGIRVARRGYRTELIDSVTLEEANCRAWPWVKQRSRWIKGYMMTWIVHMRRPRELWRELGPRGFLGFQILFLGTLSQFLLAPVLWSFWLVPMGLPHPVAGALPGGAMIGLLGLFLLTESVNLIVGWIGLRQTRHGMSPLWLPTLHGYFPLAALAAYKAAWEMVTRPFYWDKTSHGLHVCAAPPAPVADAPAPPRAVPSAFAPPRLTAVQALDRARRLHPQLLPEPTGPPETGAERQQAMPRRAPAKLIAAE
ncbi:MAG: glycosyltransferase family 2 protein [Gemmobacter sp.]